MPRRFQLLVSLLVVSNLGVGLSAYWALRNLDGKYSALLSRAVPALNDLQTLTALEVDAMRQTNPSVLGMPSPSAEMIARAREAIRVERDLRSRLLQRLGFRTNSEDRLSFERAGDDFTRAASDYLSAITTGTISDANRRRDDVVRPAFDRYLAATTKFADAVEADSLQTSNALTTRTVSLSRVLLAAGNWPLLILLLLLFTSLVILLVARHSLFMSEEHWRT